MPEILAGNHRQAKRPPPARAYLTMIEAPLMLF
jgi:hypothetical protein